jgi:hypothetical protein
MFVKPISLITVIGSHVDQHKGMKLFYSFNGLNRYSGPLTLTS